MASDHGSNLVRFAAMDHQPAREIAKRICASIIDSPVVTDRGLVSVLISMGVTQVTPSIADWVA